MELIKIHSSKDPLIAHTAQLYESSFPADARTETDKFLNVCHTCSTCILQLISTQHLNDIDE